MKWGGSAPTSEHEQETKRAQGTGLRSWSLRHRRETEKYTGTLSKKALNTRSRDLDSLLYSWGVIYVFQQGNYLRVVL